VYQKFKWSGVVGEAVAVTK